MERESAVPEPKTQSESKGKRKTTIRVMRTFLWGLGFSASTYGILLELRDPHSHSSLLLILFPLVAIITDISPREEKSVSGFLTGLVLSGCLAGIFFVRAYDWAPAAVAVLFAVFYWAQSKATGRPYLFLSAGSLLSGVISLQFPWPNEQRCLLTIVGVGVTTSLQGLWIILRYLQGDRPAYLLEPAKTPSKSSGRELMHIFNWIFGKIDYTQIISPEYEQRIRSRYQSEINQLRELGFDYQFSYGESFQLIRLFLLLPAIAIIGSWRNREVISIQEGMRFVTGFPVLTSKNKYAYAHSFGLGTKFYTAFQDGILLVSKDFADADIPAGPMIKKCARKASIGDTWAEHQKRIAELEAEGKRVDRQTSFQAYAQLARKETAPW